MHTTYKTALLSFICITGLAACRKKVLPEPPTPLIYKIYPAKARFDSTVTVYGKHLLPAGDNSTPQLSINGKAAVVTGRTDSTVTFIVPKKVGSGTVMLQIAGTTITGPDFEYEYTVTVSTVAGSVTAGPGYANGSGTAVQFNELSGLIFDQNDNLYISDRLNYCIRRMDPQGNVTLFAGTPGTLGYADNSLVASKFSSPMGMSFDQNNNLYVVDLLNNLIRKISGGQVSTIAGVRAYKETVDNPDALKAKLDPTGFCTIDNAGNLYISDNNCIRKIVPGGGVTTIAGSTSSGYVDGPGTVARFHSPAGIVDHNQELVVVDNSNYRIRKINAGNEVSTIAGNGAGSIIDASSELLACFDDPDAIAYDKNNNLIVAETNARLLRMITPSGQVVSLTRGSTGAAVDGDGRIAQFNAINSIAVNSKNEIFLADRYAIRKVVVE